MRRTFFCSTFVCGLLWAAACHGQVYSSNIVGYVNQPLYPGPNLINNPLDQQTNTLSRLFGNAPNGTTLSLWDASVNDYSETFTKVDGQWTQEPHLWPGEGALLYSPSLFTNTYVGSVVFTPGSDPGGTLLPPPVFSGPDGIYLMGCIMPLQLGGASEYGVFDYVIGRGAEVGEQFSRIDPISRVLTTTTYLGGGVWDNGAPELNVAESAFFNVGPVEGAAYVPEPTSLSLLGLVSLALLVMRKRRPA